MTFELLTQMVSQFLIFLQVECAAVKALVEEFEESEAHLEESSINFISQYPQLKDFYEDEEVNSNIQSKTEDELVIASLTVPNPQNPAHSAIWSKALRTAIIDHMITFEINISLLIEVVESYRFDVDIEELVEVIRALDILGAELRLSEYEAILFLQLIEIEEDKRVKHCGNRLPISFFDHIKVFQYCSQKSYVIGYVGSQRLIEYFFEKMNSRLDNYHIFIGLCSKGHLRTAQWLYSFGGIDIHDRDEYIFRLVCEEGHCEFAQWLYHLGDINIHARNDDAFVGACRFGHLKVAQWLYSIEGIPRDRLLTSFNLADDEQTRNWLQSILRL
jgi:hypothetical protein